MNLLERIPKTLPKENPLLFSFLVIVENMQINLRFNGKFERNLHKDLPCFEYWIDREFYTPIKNGSQPTGKYLKQMEVTAAIWKPKPDEANCELNWNSYPNGDALQKSGINTYIYDFEMWREQTSSELIKIISALTAKGNTYDAVNKKKIDYLADIFGWEFLDEKLPFVYARESTANQMFGVAARFNLQGGTYDCCPEIPFDQLKKDRLEQFGFVFNS